MSGTGNKAQLLILNGVTQTLKKGIRRGFSPQPGYFAQNRRSCPTGAWLTPWWFVRITAPTDPC